MSPSVNPKKMVKIRRGEKIKSGIPPNTLIPSIRAGKLLATDEIFVDNQGWQRLDQHPQLAPYLSDGAKNTDSPPTTSVPTKAPTEEGFKCPKCKTLQEKSKICTHCGIIFEKYYASLRQPQRSRPPPTGSRAHLTQPTDLAWEDMAR